MLAADGSVVSASSTLAERPLLSSEQLERARTASISFERGDRRRRIRRPVQIRSRDRSAAASIVVGEPLDDRNDALRGLLAQLLVVLPLALLVSSAIGYVVAGAALRPVEAMRARATEISPDTPEQRLPLPRAHDEVYRLGETLNEMLDRLDAGLERERRFVADASHELRTPLATLRAELELAARRPRTAEELEAALRSAGEEVERLVRLAEDLLTLARTDDGRMELRVERHDVRDAPRGRRRAQRRACAVQAAVRSRSRRRSTRSLVGRPDATRAGAREPRRQRPPPRIGHRPARRSRRGRTDRPLGLRRGRRVPARRSFPTPSSASAARRRRAPGAGPGSASRSSTPSPGARRECDGDEHIRGRRARVTFAVPLVSA